MEYDFSKLNDREFEALAASVIEKVCKSKVEIFKPGKDFGVDGRFWIDNYKEGIIQCKHYCRTPYSNLISKLRKDEFPKVKNLNPSKYIFITSIGLSRGNKLEIFNIFSPYIKHEDDIWGQEDLNSFLSKRENQDVVEKNFKLWINGTNVLDILFNNAITGRSQFSIREIQENSYKYVITEIHNKALEIIEKNNVIILTGEPGIGKTILANNLALLYIAKGYEFCEIEENISEAESLYRNYEQKKIIFYCDDFLGSNVYDAINNKKDSHIVRFINRVKKDNTKKFILTSRTNILNKACSQSQSFQNYNIRENEFLLTIENITTLDKAKIFYNHIYHSKLPQQFIDVIYKDKAYKKIINHKNFNPRIIDFITNYSVIIDIKLGSYLSHIFKSLNNPAVIWEGYFQTQTDDFLRALTFLTVFNKGKICENNLRDSYNTFLTFNPLYFGDNSDKSFESVRKLAIKSLLNRNQIGDQKYEYVLFNPSIADFVFGTYANEIDLICNIIKSLNSELSINYLHTLLQFNKINVDYTNRILENLFDFFYESKLQNKEWDFLLALSSLNFSNAVINKRLHEYLNLLINDDNPRGKNLLVLLLILSKFKPKIKFNNFKFLYGFIDDVIDEDTLKRLLDFVDEYNIDDDNILMKIKISVDNYLLDIFNEWDIDYSKHIIYFSNFYDTEFDIRGIEYDLEKDLDSFISDFNDNTLEKISFSRSYIISSIDIDLKLNNFLENYVPDHDWVNYDREYDWNQKGISYSIDSSTDDIDAIFER